MEAYLTTAGVAVLNRVLASTGALQFTKAELGDGECTGEANCKARTSLVHKTHDASLISAKLEGGEAVISTQYDNTGLATGFQVREIGLYVKDPTSSASVLYCYVTFGDNPDWIAPASSAKYIRTYDVTTIVSDVASVTVTTNPAAMVPYSEFLAFQQNINAQLLAMFTEIDARMRSLEAGYETLQAQVDALAE